MAGVFSGGVFSMPRVFEAFFFGGRGFRGLGFSGALSSWPRLMSYTTAHGGGIFSTRTASSTSPEAGGDPCGLPEGVPAGFRMGHCGIFTTSETELGRSAESLLNSFEQKTAAAMNQICNNKCRTTTYPPQQSRQSGNPCSTGDDNERSKGQGGWEDTEKLRG